jgi:hypothetical protein
LKVEFEAAAAIAETGFGFRVLRSTDQLLVYDGQFSQRDLGLVVDGAQRFTIDFIFEVNLTRGQYYIDVLAGHAPTQQYLARLTPAGHLTVSESQTWGGVAHLAVEATATTTADNSVSVAEVTLIEN